MGSLRPCEPLPSDAKLLYIKGMDMPPRELAWPILAACSMNCQGGTRGDFVLALLLARENLTSYVPGRLSSQASPLFFWLKTTPFRYVMHETAALELRNRHTNSYTPLLKCDILLTVQ